MAQKYKNKSSLKNIPFYSEEIENSEKKKKKFSNVKFLSELPFFSKESKELTNKQLSDALPFPPKKSEKSRKVLENVLPFYETVGILRENMCIKVMQKLVMLK